MQRYEQGWQSVSLYTGAPVAEMKRAGAAGELGKIDQAAPTISHVTLDAWLFSWLLRPQLVDHDVDLVANRDKPTQHSAA